MDLRVSPPWPCQYRVRAVCAWCWLCLLVIMPVLRVFSLLGWLCAGSAVCFLPCGVSPVACLASQCRSAVVVLQVRVHALRQRPPIPMAAAAVCSRLRRASVLCSAALACVSWPWWCSWPFGRALRAPPSGLSSPCVRRAERRSALLIHLLRLRLVWAVLVPQLAFARQILPLSHVSPPLE